MKVINFTIIMIIILGYISYLVINFLEDADKVPEKVDISSQRELYKVEMLSNNASTSGVKSIFVYSTFVDDSQSNSNSSVTNYKNAIEKSGLKVSYFHSTAPKKHSESPGGPESINTPNRVAPGSDNLASIKSTLKMFNSQKDPGNGILLIHNVSFKQGLKELKAFFKAGNSLILKSPIIDLNETSLKLFTEYMKKGQVFLLSPMAIENQPDFSKFPTDPKIYFDTYHFIYAKNNAEKFSNIFSKKIKKN